MACRITHSPLVEADLDQISDYFAGESMDLAMQFLDAVAVTEQSLLQMPEMGVLR
jgi:plasmid stabilization system protein ParE